MAQGERAGCSESEWARVIIKRKACLLEKKEEIVGTKVDAKQKKEDERKGKKEKERQKERETEMKR